MTESRTLAALVLACSLAACGGGGGGGNPGDGNDTPETADPIALGGSVVGRFENEVDEDWYRLTLAQPTTIIVETFDQGGVTCDPVNEGVDPYIGVFSESLTLLGADDDGGVPPFCSYLSVAAPAGTVYVAVGGIPPFPFNYTLKVTAAP